MKLKFTKMHGAGNDFIMIDDRAGQVPWQDHFLMAALAARRTGIGCEGIILIHPSDQADFRMRFLNPDGTEVELCGNGARCAAAFAHARGATGKSMTMETLCGLMDAEIVELGVRVWMPEVTRKNYGLTLSIGGQTVTGSFLNTGVPHFVVPVEDIGAVDVMGLGRLLRQHQAFSPEGTNVSFVSFRPPDRMSMRTYERGVEAESGACGTGAVACVVFAVETAGLTLPVRVRTSSGYELIVDGDWRGRKCTGLTLSGPVKVVFEGEVDLDTLDLGGEME